MNDKARMEVDWKLDVKDLTDGLIKVITEQKENHVQPAILESMAEKLSTLASNGSAMRLAQDVLNDLSYPEMTLRHSNIAEAHWNTFEWIFSEDNSDRKSSLTRWLEKGEGTYWVSGKAGSGKSTLLKYLSKHPRTLDFLRPWATPLKLVVAKYFFWNSGSRLQKSQEGLIRSLLFEVLRLCPHLIPKVFPSRHGQAVTGFWDRGELMDALNCLLQQSIEKYRFCFFIDGLDEYSGDHFELVQLFRNIFDCPGIKICVSSRPLNVFREVLGKREQTHMCLEQYTRQDIAAYVRDKMESCALFFTLEKEDPRSTELIEEIVDKAQGVFIWVILVVRSLIRGLANADTFRDLQRRLQEFPQELEPFLRHMFNTIEPFYRSETAKYCQVALNSRVPYRLRTYSLLDEENLEYALSVHLRSVEWGSTEASVKLLNTQKRINARCHGLLETYDSSQVVDFFHRTVRDFLSLEDMQISLNQEYPAGRKMHMLLCRTLLGELKCIPEIDHPTSAHNVRGSKSTQKISNFRTMFDMRQCMKILQDFFFHAEQIEWISNETPLLMIEELRKLLQVSLPALELAHGFDNNLGRELENMESFVQFSIDYGLAHYPALKFMDNSVDFSRTTREILLVRLLLTASELIQNNHRTLDVVKMLLQQGTKVNCAISKTRAASMLYLHSTLSSKMSNISDSYLNKVNLETPWQIFLFYLYFNAKTASSLQLENWVETVKVLLKFGADAKAQVEVGRTNPLSLPDFYNVVFPSSDAQVLCEILQKRQVVLERVTEKPGRNEQPGDLGLVGQDERHESTSSIAGWLAGWIPFRNQSTVP
jgi:hypothetical protein